MNELLISVITVCYNSEKTIEKTLNSMLHQTYKQYEYIIIDGGSKDRTLEILNSYQPLFGNRIKIFSEPDEGIYDAMNKGISKANGQIIGMINSDDWYEEDALEIIAEMYKNDKLTIFYGMQREYENNIEKLCWIKSADFLGKHMITHPTCFVTSDVYKKIGGFDTQYKSSADYDFMLRARENNIVFKPIHRIIANFRLGGISGNNIGRIETARILYKYNEINKEEMLKEVFINKLKIVIKRIIRRK